MPNIDTNDRPAMTWVEVRDASGRSRMEARWVIPGQLHPAKPLAA